MEDFHFALLFGVTNKEQFFVKTLDLFSEQTGNGYSEIKDGIPMHTYESAMLSNLIHTVYSENIVIDKELIEQTGQLPNYVSFFLLPEEFDYNNFDPLWLLFYSPASDRSNVIYSRLCKIKEIKEMLQQSLKLNYNQGLAEVYTKYFL